uniref:Uncharacterized protein n=1 Tax=Marseillevirus LCMAC201 TaxID=2506605 RepID=A0A481YW76_9VIRU|nr:MAG: uncharacterized protein LCMAC201_02790 [Marseillevirus LCMAC201]
MVNIKDILLAVLVGYIVLDLSFSFVLKRKRPLLFQHMANVVKKEKGSMCIAVVLAVLAGAGTYYLASQNM